MTTDQHDRLWLAACAVTAAYETYQEPNRARPKEGLFLALDRLIDACGVLTRVSDEICPVGPREQKS
ncbi:MAG TPA: hypothetical protein VJA26_18545 [Gammaproteobacteria bacterium]|nr:hypothetical protein [Gammaproteobacteria bacterium]